MANKIVTLKTRNGEDSLYPRTVSEAIDAGDGMSLESALHGRDFAFFKGSYPDEERCSIGLYLGDGDSLRIGYCINPLHTNKHYGRKDALFSDYFPMHDQRQFELPTSEMESFTSASGVYAVSDATIARHAITMILNVTDFQFEPTMLDDDGANVHGIFGGYQYRDAVHPGVIYGVPDVKAVVAEFTKDYRTSSIDKILYGKCSEVKQAPDSSLVAFYTFRFSSKFAKNLTPIGLRPENGNYAISRLALLWQCTLIAKFPEGSVSVGQRRLSLPAGTQYQIFMFRRKIRLS